MYIYIYTIYFPYHIYGFKKSIGGFRGSSLRMSPQAVLGLVLEGIKTNWWGLACPHHCTQPSVGLLGFCFLLGWISGLASTLALVWWLSGFWCGSGSDCVRGPSTRLASRARVLSSYLHEPNLLQPRRRD